LVVSLVLIDKGLAEDALDAADTSGDLAPGGGWDILRVYEGLAQLARDFSLEESVKQALADRTAS
jgi:hypothetical protein